MLHTFLPWPHYQWTRSKWLIFGWSPQVVGWQKVKQNISPVRVNLLEDLEFYWRKINYESREIARKGRMKRQVASIFGWNAHYSSRNTVDSIAFHDNQNILLYGKDSGSYDNDSNRKWKCYDSASGAPLSLPTHSPSQSRATSYMNWISIHHNLFRKLQDFASALCHSYF